MTFQKSLISLVIATAATTLVGCDDDENSVNNPDIGGGQVLIYTTSGEFLDAANVGHLPDMVKFSDDHTLVVANEGEPEDDYVADDEGSISIITLNSNNTVQDVTTLGFSEDMLQGNVRIKPDSNAAQDLEPEYVAVNAAGDTAWVTLQENNAVAIVDLNKKEIQSVKALGAVTVADQKMDISDDGNANPVMNNPANIFALYMPDTIQSYSVNGQDFYVTANEGDDREYGDYEDLEKAKDLNLSAELQAALDDTDMKKLRVLTDLGKNEQGVYEALYMTGTRSFTIWNSAGEAVFDSASDFEEELAANFAATFNTRVDDVDYVDANDAEYEESDFFKDIVDKGMVADQDYEVIGDKVYYWEGVDARSLKKGAEPEALALHQIGAKTFAYIGLEKQGGFFVYDVTSPENAEMIEYVNHIEYDKKPSEAGDLAPEGMVAFTQDSQHYLAVAHELSSTLALFELAQDGTATAITSVALGSFDEGAAEIVDYSAADKKLFVTNAETQMVDVIDVADPSNASKVSSIDFSEYADDLQSVSVKNGLLAIAVKRKDD